LISRVVIVFFLQVLVFVLDENLIVFN